MKLKNVNYVFSCDSNLQNPEFIQAYSEISYAISEVTWPGSNFFTINPTKKGNGVKPIKSQCMKHLESCKWAIESRLSFGEGINPGPLDASKKLSDGRIIAFEWETGNISSSHRAINKMLLGMVNGYIAIGVLVLPSREMYTYLTDRIGNYQELSPYFPVFSYRPLPGCSLIVMEIEHDSVDTSVPLIPKGFDGLSEKPAK